jgi:hypothetical protein
MMSKYLIVLRRGDIKGFLSQQSIGTNALNAMASIQWVTNSEIVEESDEQVKLTFNWVGEENFYWLIDEQLVKYGLVLVDIKNLE